MKIVITGGMACGKSTLVKKMRELLPYYAFLDFDAEVKALYENSNVKAELMYVFGTCVKAEISDMVYNDETKMLALGSIMNRRLFDLVSDALRLVKDVVIDMPLYYECEKFLHYKPDLVICVSCDDETQIQRIIKRNGFSPEKINRILASQMPQSIKREKADIVVYTNHTPEMAQQDLINALKVHGVINE
jgi:dephospho-CoA kinase